MNFIQNPEDVWSASGFKQKNLVQSLLFTDVIEYSKESGFGTVNFSLPFKLLQEINVPNSNLVEILSRNWNPYLATLLDWEKQLQWLVA